MWKRKWAVQEYSIGKNERDDSNWPERTPEEIRANEDRRRPDWIARILLADDLVLCRPGIAEIITISRDGKSGRIYPPFPVNERDYIRGALANAQLPQGNRTVTSYIPVPNASNIPILRTSAPSNQLYCKGFRIDMERGFPYSNVFQEVIDHIAQYTHQWWLRAPRSPFRGNVYLSAFINRDYNVRDEFYYKGAGEVESTWLGATESQELLGFEKLLTKETWHSCAMALERSIPAETGILAFSDAVAQYMADNDLRCLLNLTDSFEILANKKQMLDGHRPESRKDKLLEKTPLASSPSKAVITKLFADRDNVAHGRQPYALNRDGTTTIESYLGAVGEVVETYLKTLKLGEWEKASRMEISRKKKKSKKPRKQ